MSLEQQLRDALSDTCRVDRELGCLPYEMLVGRPPPCPTRRLPRPGREFVDRTPPRDDVTRQIANAASGLRHGCVPIGGPM